MAGKLPDNAPKAKRIKFEAGKPRKCFGKDRREGELHARLLRKEAATAMWEKQGREWRMTGKNKRVSRRGAPC